MIAIRSKTDLDLMRKSGVISTKALQAALSSIKPGATGEDVDRIVADIIYKLGGDLSYKTVPGYKWATCITVNEQVVHGIPTHRVFEDGDLVGVDLAATFNGWHTDTACTILVGKDKEKERFLQVGKQALLNGVKFAVEGKRIGDIASAIQHTVEDAGYSVVRSLVGHGVGKSLHEDPEVPGFGTAGTGHKLKSGMTLAIEVIYTKGSGEVVLEDDDWTISSEDGSWGGLFEMTVVVGKKRAEILTDWRTSSSYPIVG